MKSFYSKLRAGLSSFVVLAAVLLLISGCAPANQQPSIISLKAKQDVLSPLSSCLIECVASDEDGDELNYEWLVSMGSINGNGAAVAWSAPEDEGIFRIEVKVTDGNGGEATGSVIITVKNNHPPTINDLTADADWVNPLDSCQVKCAAEDPDGDELSYEWTASGGDISGKGEAVNWTAPDKVGLWDITVIVTDGYGGQDKRSLAVSVALNPPPVIERMIIFPEEPEYVKECPGEYLIFMGKSCEVACIAAGASGELNYEWLAQGDKTDGGQISGEGSVITWTAPDKRDTITIMVTVSDATGIETSKNVVFAVKTCTCSLRCV